jgi:hypothetical protein
MKGQKMDPIIQKIGFMAMLVLFTSTLSLAAPDKPVCVPGDTKCLHPEQPMLGDDPVLDESLGTFAGMYLVYDDDDYRDRPYYDNDGNRDGMDRDRDRDRERHEEHEEHEHHGQHHHDVHIDLGR